MSKLSMFEAMKQVAPNLVSITLLREAAARYPAGSAEWHDIKKREVPLQREVIETLLRVDWKGSVSRMADLVRKIRDENRKAT